MFVRVIYTETLICMASIRLPVMGICIVLTCCSPGVHVAGHIMLAADTEYHVSVLIEKASHAIATRLLGLLLGRCHRPRAFPLVSSKPKARTSRCAKWPAHEGGLPPCFFCDLAALPPISIGKSISRSGLPTCPAGGQTAEMHLDLPTGAVREPCFY